MAELAAFDPKLVESAIAQEIKDRFAGMVPEEAWRGLVKKHIDQFLTGKGPGTLEEMVKIRLSEQVKKELDAYFDQNGKWGWQWKDGQQVAAASVEALVMKHMPEIIAMTLAGSVQRFIETMRQNIGYNGNRF